MRTLASIVLVALAALASTSCSTLYEVGYGWTLEGHDDEHALAVEVEDLHFRFHPTAAGVAFSVENKGDEDAAIDWNQSYFMAPDGTSTAPLRTESLLVGGAKAGEAPARSILPRGATMRRFVALDSRAGEKADASAFTIRELISMRTTRWERERGWVSCATEPTGFEADLMPNTLNRFDFPLHYPLSFRAAGPQVLEETAKIVEQVKATPLTVLGLAIEVDGEMVKQRFEFRVEGVHVTTLNYTKDGDKTIGTRVLAVEARATKGWAIEDFRAASGVQERKGMEAAK
jgi:hypothetical protein